jgi:hypothetical protein
VHLAILLISIAENQLHVLRYYNYTFSQYTNFEDTVCILHSPFLQHSHTLVGLGIAGTDHFRLVALGFPQEPCQGLSNKVEKIFRFTNRGGTYLHHGCDNGTVRYYGP